MKSTKLFEAFNGISEEYLIEAELYAARRRKKAKILRIVLPAAAVAALLAAALLAVLPLARANGDEQPGINFEPARQNGNIDAVIGVDDPAVSVISPSSGLGSLASSFPATLTVLTPERTAIEELVFDKFEDHVEITDYTGESDVIILPDAIDDLPITRLEISEKTADTVTAIRFNDDDFEEVVVPKTKSIKLTIGKDVTKVDNALLHNAGVYAFEVESGNQTYASFCGMLYNKNCTTLIACPAGYKVPVIEYHPNNRYGMGRYTSYLAAQLQEISDRAFQNCSSVRSITLPEQVTQIGARAFTGCSSLRALVLPQSLTKIASNVFERCPTLAYLRYNGDYDDFTRFTEAGLTLPETACVFCDLCGNAAQETVNEVISFFKEAEKAAALLSRFEEIECADEYSETGARKVCAEGVGCKADLAALLENYFDGAICDKLMADGYDDYYEEIGGQLYCYEKTAPARYDEGSDKREYAVDENEDGCVLTVRMTVPLIKTLAYVECRYELLKTETGWRFTGSYTLPANAWYGLYLIESVM